MADITIKLKAETEITNLKQIKDMFKDFDRLGDDIRKAIQEAFAGEPIEVKAGKDTVGYFEDIKRMILTTKMLIRSMLPYIKPVSGHAGIQTIFSKIEEVEKNLEKFDDEILDEMLEGGRKKIDEIIEVARVRLIKAIEEGETSEFKKVQKAMDILLAHFGKLSNILSEFGPRKRGKELELSVLSQEFLSKFISKGEAKLQNMVYELIEEIFKHAQKEFTMGGKGRIKFLDIYTDHILFSLASILTKRVSSFIRDEGQKIEYLGLLPRGEYERMTEEMRGVKGKDAIRQFTEIFSKYYSDKVLALLAESFVGGQEGIYESSEAKNIVLSAIKNQLEEVVKGQIKDDELKRAFDKFMESLTIRWMRGEEKSYMVLQAGEKHVAKLGYVPISAREGIESEKLYRGAMSILSKEEREKFDRLIERLTQTNWGFTEEEKIEIMSNLTSIQEFQKNQAILTEKLIGELSRVSNPEVVERILDILKSLRLPVGGS